MKVAVIFGGTSSEREVSVLSGLSAAEALGKKYMVKPIHYNGNPSTLLNDLYDIDLPKYEINKRIKPIKCRKQVQHEYSPCGIQEVLEKRTSHNR